MNRRLLLVVTGWLVVGLVATGAGVVVTAFLGESITGSASRALSPAEVRRALDAAPSPSPSGDTAGNGSPSSSEDGSGDGLRSGSGSGPRSGSGDGSGSGSGSGSADGSEAPSVSPSSTGSAGASPSASAPAPPSAGAAQGQTKVFSARGGAVVARCAGGLVTLRSWTPAQGYEVKDAERGPRDKVRVRFEGGDARTEIEIHCSNDHPIATIKND
ncbi:hypothetical protein OG589_25610 [Sphaerisporangium sp. NBC_01403]|uniref:hypothetical protein n=1 Tax=Sphaerisporangium sp. NBC_01403 TaxID=2903599 RepID=UPI00325040E0